MIGDSIPIFYHYFINRDNCDIKIQMKRLIFIYFTLILSFSASMGQKKYINLELLGNGMVYSFNHEWISAKNRNLSIGVYIMPFDIRDFLYKGFGVPTNYSVLIPKKDHFFEIGTGFSFFYGYLHFPEVTLNGIKRVPLGSLYVISRLAYRKEWNNKMFRISLNPIYVISDNLFNYINYNSRVQFFGDANWRVNIGIAFGFKY